MAPQHDGVISNASGAAVRADLNNALAALITNSSGATSPGTTYAYQWWADTTTGQLKLRNSANSAWITIFELDGTMLMEDGSLAAPGLAFASDLDTGFSRSAANKINFSTGGAERLEIGSSEVVFNDPSNDVDFRVESNGNSHMLFVDAGNDRVGIGESSPGRNLVVNSGSSSGYIQLVNTNSGTAASNGFEIKLDSAGAIVDLINRENGAMRFFTNNTQQMQIDTSGRLLVGTSSARTINTTSSWKGVQIAGTTGFESLIIERYEGSGGPAILLGKSRGTSVGDYTIVQDDDGLGSLIFFGADGSDMNSQGARIDAFVDGTPGSNDMPGRLVFSTTADGASSTTERMRITSSGNVGLGRSSASCRLHIATSVANASSPVGMQIGNDGSGSGTGASISLGAGNAAASTAGNIAGFFDGTGTALSFSTSSNYGVSAYAERMRILSGGGLTFNGDTAQANALDDYEEGTFTPGLALETPGTSSFSYTAQNNGHYTKVGRLVHCKIEIRLSSFSKGTGSGHLKVTGLPFTSANSLYGQHVGNFASFNSSLPTGAGETPVFIVFLNDTVGSIRYLRNNSSWATFPDPDNDSQYKLEVTYHAA